MPTKTDRIRFVCAHCDYRARIPAKYDGETIACPNCKKPSVATADEGPATGQTVEIRKGDAQPEGDDKFRFVCADCSYRARIPVKYAGMAIKCPGCGKPQEANRSDQETEHTGGTVEIRKVDLTTGGDRFLFQCGGCGYRARLPAKYHLQDIKCPGCGTPQTAEAVPNPGPSTGSTVNISKVEAAGMTADPSPRGALTLDEPMAAAGIDLDAPGDDHVEVRVAAPVRTAQPIAAAPVVSSNDLALPEAELAADETPQPTSYDPFGDQARDAAEAQAPLDNDSQDLLGELRSTSDRLQSQPTAPAKPVASKQRPAPAKPAAAKPQPAAAKPQPAAASTEARRGSDRPPAVAGAAKKGPMLVLGSLLAVAVIALGVLGYLYSQTSSSLEAELSAHQQTRRELSDERGAHGLTQGHLDSERQGHAGTREELGTAHGRISELDQQVLDTTALLNITKDQLAKATELSADLRKQVDAAFLEKRQVERELETVKGQMDQVVETMRKAGHETLETFLEDALKRRR